MTMIPESGLDIAARRNVRNIRLTLPFRVDTLRPSHRSLPVSEFIREIASDADPRLSAAPISNIAPLALVPGPSLDSLAAPAFPLLSAVAF